MARGVTELAEVDASGGSAGAIGRGKGPGCPGGAERAARAVPPRTPHAEAFALWGRMVADRHDDVGAEYAFFLGPL